MVGCMNRKDTLKNVHTVNSSKRKRFYKTIPNTAPPVFSPLKFFIVSRFKFAQTKNNFQRVKIGTFIKYYKISQLIHTQSIAN